jgi:hypothetical protein
MAMDFKKEKLSQKVKSLIFVDMLTLIPLPTIISSLGQPKIG